MEFYIPLEEQKKALASVESLTDFIMDNNLDNEWLEFFWDSAYDDGEWYVSHYLDAYYRKMHMSEEEEAKDRALWDEDFKGDFPRNVDEGDANHSTRDFVALLSATVLSKYSVHDIGEIEVWRGIEATDINRVNKRYLGECWTDDKDVAEEWVGGHSMVMHAFVEPWGIDWISSFWYHTVDSESEIRVCDQKAIKYVEIKDMDGQVLYSDNRELNEKLYKVEEADKSRFVDKMKNLTDEQKSRVKSAFKYNPNLESVLYSALGDWQKSANWKWEDMEKFIKSAEDMHRESVKKGKRDGKIACEEGVDYNIVYDKGNIKVYEVLSYPFMCQVASNSYKPVLFMDIPSWAWDAGDINEWVDEAYENDTSVASGAHWCVAMKNTDDHWVDYFEHDGIRFYVGCDEASSDSNPLGKVCFYLGRDNQVHVWDAEDNDRGERKTYGQWGGIISKIELKHGWDEKAFAKAFPEDAGYERGFISFADDVRGMGYSFSHEPEHGAQKICVCLEKDEYGCWNEMWKLLPRFRWNVAYNSKRSLLLLSGSILDEGYARELRKDIENAVDYALNHMEYKSWVDVLCEEIGDWYDMKITPPSEDFDVDVDIPQDYCEGMKYGFSAHIREGKPEAYLYIRGDIPYLDELYDDMMYEHPEVMEGHLEVYGDDAYDDMVVYRLDGIDRNIGRICRRMELVLKYMKGIEDER